MGEPMTTTQNTLVIDSVNRRLWIHFDGSMTTASQFASADPADDVAAVVWFDRLVANEGDEVHIDVDAFIPHLMETWGKALADRDDEILAGLGEWVLGEANDYQAD